jgi:retrograde regulation protein 2
MSTAAPDIITLDNLSQTLTPWNPEGESQLYAIVDMGRHVSFCDFGAWAST